MLLSTQSHTFSRYKKAAYMVFFISQGFSISCQTANILSIKPLPFLNPHCTQLTIPSVTNPRYIFPTTPSIIFDASLSLGAPLKRMAMVEEFPSTPIQILPLCLFMSHSTSASFVNILPFTFIVAYLLFSVSPRYIFFTNSSFFILSIIKSFNHLPVGSK